MSEYMDFVAEEVMTIAIVTEDGQSFEDLGIDERKEGQVILKCNGARNLEKFEGSYDYERDRLSIVTDRIPFHEVALSKPDPRGRDVYTARPYVYVPKERFDQLREMLEERDNYIQWLFQFVPEDRRDEVYKEIAEMGINYISADDV